MALTDISHPTDIAMLTDLYELTMAQGLWESGKANEQGCFTAFYRDHPFGSAYAVMCGTAELPELVENLRFTPEDIDYLASLQAPAGGAMFKSAFLDYLRDFRAHVNIDAVHEGELVFPREPMVRVTGPALECQLLETALLNIVGFQTLVATKTARVVLAADGRPVAEFGLRRAQGPDGGLAVARASYVAGCSSTSNVLAGRRYGIPVFGTHAHSWVMSFDSELEAFRAFAKSSPKNCTLLIDTYDVREGCEHAITVAKEMEAVGERLSAIRIDSGDLPVVVARVRELLDELGATSTRITVTNDLDEYTVAGLSASPVDSFGVGTSVVVGSGSPTMGMVYKLVARTGDDGEWVSVAKKSADKASVGGRKSVRRLLDARGVARAELLFLGDGPGGSAEGAELGEHGREVLVPLVQDGELLPGHTGADGIAAARERHRRVVAELPPVAMSLTRGDPAIPTEYR